MASSTPLQAHDYEVVLEAREVTDSKPAWPRARVGAVVAALALCACAAAVWAGRGSQAMHLAESKSTQLQALPNFNGDCNSLLIHEGCNSIQAWSCERNPGNYGPGLNPKDMSEEEFGCCCPGPSPPSQPPPEEPEWASVAPKLFCTALMQPKPSYEPDLLAAQAKAKVGMFSCNDFGVFSNGEYTLDGDIKSTKIEGSLKCRIGGKHHTAYNTGVFIRFWQAVNKDKRTSTNDWIVKADPDTVFVPWRLRQMLRAKYESGKPKKAVYLRNCQLGLHGPIEVISKEAMKKYQDKEKDCTESDVRQKAPQEDVYFEKCAKVIGIEMLQANNLLLESSWACNERPSSPDAKPPCFSPQVAFHPFKTTGSWFHCWDQAKNQNFGNDQAALMKVMYPKAEIPSSANQHHA